MSLKYLFDHVIKLIYSGCVSVIHKCFKVVFFYLPLVFLFRPMGRIQDLVLVLTHTQDLIGGHLMDLIMALPLGLAMTFP